MQIEVNVYVYEIQIGISCGTSMLIYMEHAKDKTLIKQNGAQDCCQKVWSQIAIFFMKNTFSSNR